MTDRPPTDPADHAVDFSKCYFEDLDRIVATRMEEVGVPHDRIGSSDHKHGIAWCAFNPHELDGGGVGPGGRINLDAGLFHPGLMKDYGPDAEAAFRDAPLRARMDAGIAHEYEEGNGLSHQEAVERTPDTELRISHAARALASKIRDGQRSR